MIEGRTPDRALVEHVWEALLAGEISRESACAWVDPYVRGGREMPGDPLVEMGILYLHGSDLASSGGSLVHHGLHTDDPADGYVKSLDDVASDLRYWRAQREAYDQDAHQWLARRLMTTIRHLVTEEGTAIARRYAEAQIAEGRLSARQTREALGDAAPPMRG